MTSSVTLAAIWITFVMLYWLPPVGRSAVTFGRVMSFVVNESGAVLMLFVVSFAFQLTLYVPGMVVVLNVK